MKTESPPKPRARSADTEARILVAARTVFVRRGTAGARMQEIAAEAGVNPALLHYYFDSKDTLAQRVFHDVAQSMSAAIVPLFEPGPPLDALIERFVVAYIDTVRRAPFLPGYILAEAQQSPERLERLILAAVGSTPRHLVDPFLARLARTIDEGVARGTLRPMSPRQLLVNVMALAVFPFVALPVLRVAFAFDDVAFHTFLDERRRELPTFILAALRP